MQLHQHCISDIAAKVAEVLKAYRGYCAEFGIDDGHQVINNLGGKDSGATELLACAILGDNYRSVAADTGNEHLDHSAASEKPCICNGGGDPVEIVSAEYPQELFVKRREKITKAWQRKQTVMAGAYRGIACASRRARRYGVARVVAHALQAPASEPDTSLDAALSAPATPGNPFPDMALLHGSFPMGRQRFCTDELKMQVVFDKVLAPLLEDGRDVVAVVWRSGG